MRNELQARNAMLAQMLEEQNRLSSLIYQTKQTIHTEYPSRGIDAKTNFSRKKLTKYQLPDIDDLIQGIKTPKIQED